MLTSLLVAVIVFGLVAYILQLMPIEPPFKQIAYVILLVGAFLYFIKFLPTV